MVSNAVGKKSDTPGADPSGQHLVRCYVAGKYIDVDVTLGNPSIAAEVKAGKLRPPNQYSDADILRALAAAMKEHIAGNAPDVAGQADRPEYRGDQRDRAVRLADSGGAVAGREP